MGDYTKYIKWIQAFSSTPSSKYKSLDEWLKAVMRKHQPVNYHAWDQSSKDDLGGQMTTEWGGVEKKGAKTIRTESRRELRAVRVTEISQNLIFRSGVGLTPTLQRNVESMEIKRTEGKSFNKAELKTLHKLVGLRRVELREKFGYSPREAQKRAWEEYKR